MTAILFSLGLIVWGVYVLVSKRPPAAKRLLIAGLALRVAGALVYLYILDAVYGGGDYVVYYNYGQKQALWMERGLWEYAWNGLSGTGESLLGTQFVINITAALIYGLNASLLSLFVLFSAFGYIGCVLFARAVGEAYGTEAYIRYLRFTMLFPSLWFWPSPLGKDGLVLMGLGMATLGVVRSRGSSRWAFLAGGTALVFAIRPQMAAVLALSVALAFALASTQRWTVGRIAQLGVGLVVLVVAFFYAGQNLGFSLIDVERLELYVTSRADVTAYGGSSFALEGPVALRPLEAFLTVLFRPFPWEANGFTALLTSIEIIVLWIIVLANRASVVSLFRLRPRHRLFWLGVVFFVLFSTLAGLSVGNFGTLVRQRVHAYPFLFVFIALAPAVRRIVARRKSRDRGAAGGAATVAQALPVAA